jgi:phosphoribosylpyrophosphate synthetase
MLATGGSCAKAIEILKEKGAKRIIYMGIVGVDEGINKVRENHPDVREIIRRFNTDYEDFDDIDFDYIEIPNDTYENFTAGVEEIVCQIETMLAQGQN